MYTTGDFVAWNVNGTVWSGKVISVGTDGLIAAVLVERIGDEPINRSRIDFVLVRDLKTTKAEAAGRKVSDMRGRILVAPTYAPRNTVCEHASFVASSTGWTCRTCGHVEVWA